MPPCVAKTCAERPVFARVVWGAGGSRSKQMSKDLKQMLDQGEQYEAPGCSWKSGHQQHLRDQKTRTFPEERRIFSGLCALLLNQQNAAETPWFCSATPKGQKKHINFVNINFLGQPKTLGFGPPEKSLCASFPGKERKRGT